MYPGNRELIEPALRLHVARGKYPRDQYEVNNLNTGVGRTYIIT